MQILGEGLESVIQELVGSEYSQEQPDAKYVIHTIFCSQLKPTSTSQPQSISMLLRINRHFLIISLMISMIYVMYYLMVNRKNDPLRQRAPIIAFAHMMSMFAYLVFLYFLELLPLQSWAAQDITGPEDVPYSRKFSKAVIYYLRMSFGIVYTVRVMVIHCQWKCHRNSWKITKLFTKESTTLAIVLPMALIAFIYVVFLKGNVSALFYASLNWYDSTKIIGYQQSSVGVFRMFEMILLASLIYIMRNFPSNFGVKKEIVTVFMIGFLTATVSSALIPLNLGDNTSKCDQSFWPYFSAQFAFEYIRMVVLTFSIYFCNRPTKLVPPIHARALTDFRVFVTSEICFDVFKKYLLYRNIPQASRQLEDYIANELRQKEQTNLSSIFAPTVIGPMLNEVFMDFQETNSFYNLTQLFEEYEAVFHLRFKLMVIT
jgi:hypothetical protein